MPSLVIFDIAIDEALRKRLIDEAGFQSAISVYYPAVGPANFERWPTIDELPKNMLYHPSMSAKEASREAAEYVFTPGCKSTVMGFETTSPHVIWSNGPEFDHSKPSKTLAEIRKS